MHAPAPSTTDKIIFANQLRGIAALLIVITHYFGVYFGAQPFVAAITASPELHLAAPAWVPYMDFPVLKGPFGVAVFFLISGFVIPLSLQKNSAPGFLLARVFRIYPTYLCCLAIGLLAVWGATHYWGTSFSPASRALLHNGLLVHNLLGTGSLDTVNWTLAIEIKFYLLAACATPAFLRFKPWVLAAIAAAVIGLDAVVPRVLADASLQAWHHPLSNLSTDMNYVLFMLIGVLFYQHYRGLLASATLAIGIALLSAAFAAAWMLGQQQAQFPIIGKYYYYALGVFAACYLLRTRFRRVAVLDFLADVSYPLYVVHALTGYTLMKLAMAQGLPFGAAVTLVLGCVLLLSWLVHTLVETHSSEFGKKMAGALRRRAIKAA